ncbi:hypothetical protein [Rhizobium terricola]|jgi:hypothetical protein|uniref:Transmembrane protein n=1 Tax=Rhizobium terricola TaxID=2728849 RepID=A0A7Y0AYP4_9HYPH|nr:hypothetical protein [Rhizobium terricola]NML75933.1 hypothetical protein [Rhizobium terricola]
MANEDFWKAVRSRERSSQRSGKTGVLNLALLFGTAAVALSLVVTPMLAGKTEKKSLAFEPDQYDMMSTGSIPKAEGGKRYTIRRSVLQETPGSVCIVDGFGTGQGC